MITITRYQNVPVLGNDNTENAKDLLSQNQFESWDAAFDYLVDRGLPIDEPTRTEISSHDDTQFVWSEFLNFGDTAYTTTVHYDVRNDGSGVSK